MSALEGELAFRCAEGGAGQGAVALLERLPGAVEDARAVAAAMDAHSEPNSPALRNSHRRRESSGSAAGLARAASTNARRSAAFA